MDTQRILRQLYVSPPRRRWSRWRRSAVAAFTDWVRLRSWRLAMAAIAFGVWIVAHVHYYNMLVQLEWAAKGARSKIAAQEQRRYETQVALETIMHRYSEYEGKLLTGLTELRTAAISGQLRQLAVDPVTAAASSAAAPPGPAPAGASAIGRPSPPSPEFGDLLAQLKVVAEQYPELKLTQNLQQFTAHIIDNEKEIAQRIMEYNEAVNAYTTATDTFPANIFARVSGFKSMPFYQVDPNKTRFQEVSF